MNIKHRTDVLGHPASGMNGPGEHAGESEISLRYLIGVIRYRLWLFLIPVTACVAVAVAIALLSENKYTSTAEIMLNVEEANIVDIDGVLSMLPGDARLIEGEIASVKSNENLATVIRNLDLISDPEFWDPSDADLEAIGAANVSESRYARFAAIKALKKNIDVQQLGLSYVISISATSVDPDKAAEIANALAKTYIQQGVDLKNDATRQASEWLGERADILRNRVKEAELAVVEFKSSLYESNITGPEYREQQISEVHTQLVEAQAEHAQARALLEEMTRRLEEGSNEMSVGLLLVTDKDSPLTELRNELNVLEATRDDLRTRYGENNPRVVSIDKRIADASRRLDTEIRRGVDAQTGIVAAAERRETVLREAIRGLLLDGTREAEELIKLRELEAVAEAERRIYTTFLDRMNELAQGSGSQADARIISTAIPPDAPAGPGGKVLVLIAGVFGSMMGLGLVFISAAMTSDFRSDMELETQLDIRSIAKLPRLPGNPSRRDMVRTALSRTGETSEEMGLLRRALRSAVVAITGCVTDGNATVLITSVSRKEGHSTLCVLLAGFLRRIGASTVVVDCDFSDPSIREICGLPEGPDLVDCLSGAVDLASVIYSDPETDIDIVPLTNSHNLGSEIIYGEAFTKVLDELRRSYRVVIIDASAVNEAADARWLCREANMTVLTVAWRSTTVQRAKKAVEELHGAGCTNLVAAMTMVDPQEEARYLRVVHDL